MGYNEMDLVWDKSQATKTDKLVLLAIARRYSRDKGSWPSQKSLAKVCGISTRSVRASLSRLEALGELTWVTGNSKSAKANLYRITLFDSAKTSAISVTETSAIDAKTSAISDKNFRPLNKELNKRLNSEIEIEIELFWPNDQEFRTTPFTPVMLAWARSFGFGSPGGISYLKLYECWQRYEAYQPYFSKVGAERVRLFKTFVDKEVAQFGASRTEGDRA